MSPVFGVAIIIIIILIIVYLQIRVKKGDIKPKTDFSYKSTINISLTMMLIVLLFSIAFYLWSKSFESTLAIFLFLTACLLLNTLRELLNDYHIKRKIGNNTKKQ